MPSFKTVLPFSFLTGCFFIKVRTRLFLWRCWGSSLRNGLEQSTLVVYFPYRCTLLGRIRAVAMIIRDLTATLFPESLDVDNRCLFPITAVVQFDVRVRDARLTLVWAPLSHQFAVAVFIAVTAFWRQRTFILRWGGRRTLGKVEHLQILSTTRPRQGGLMVSALDSGVSGPVRVRALFLGKTLNSHSATLHPGV